MNLCFVRSSFATALFLLWPFSAPLFFLLRIFYLSPGFALAVRILSLFFPELHLLRQEGVTDLSWQAEAKGAGSSPHVFLTFTALRFNVHIYFR